MQITSQLVKDFYAEIAGEFDAEIRSKNDSQLMKLIAVFLDGIGVVDKATFVDNFTVTIGKTVYTPFEIGTEGNGWDLWDQISVGLHEVVHVRQWRDDPAGFMLKYLCNKSERATYEAEAYGADLEFSHWLQDPLDVTELAGRLASYGLGSEHVAFAAAYLSTYEDVLLQGGSVAPTAKWAIDWLTAKGVTP
jgi:hypothetical protein